MKIPRLKTSDILFIALIVLLLIPQTRTPIQVAVNKLKMLVWTPSVEAMDNQKKVVPFSYKVRDLNGKYKEIPIGEKQVTFLSYWATWCPPCLAELPSIQALYNDYGDKVNFVLLTQENTQKVERFMNKKEYDLPIYFPQMQTPEALEEKSIPTNYIIDTKGNIIIKETGAADWNSTKVRKVLDNLVSY
ncbi:TlpA family protein disulfide reductase [Maribacter sp. CXY002]|uniref:TlpA family protein disulfide reductase n=1 Tax=Maribacter luteocoastalis TaxID=3407671 RepID=UPI003B679EB5